MAVILKHAEEKTISVHRSCNLGIIVLPFYAKKGTSTCRRLVTPLTGSLPRTHHHLHKLNLGYNKHTQDSELNS